MRAINEGKFLGQLKRRNEINACYKAIEEYNKTLQKFYEMKAKIGLKPTDPLPEEYRITPYFKTKPE